MKNFRINHRLGMLSRRILAASVVFAAFAAAFMTNAVNVGATNITEVISAALNAEKKPAYASFTGTVVSVMDYYGDATKKFVLLEDENEALMNFVLSDSTYIAGDTELAEGVKVTGYYDALRPVLMIYPPQHDAVAFWDGNGAASVTFDRFDENLISYGGMLKLNNVENAEIIMQDGTPFDAQEGKTVEESLSGRILMVYYDVSTRSIPAQTNPTKIVVFYETITTMPIEIIEMPQTNNNILPAAGTPVNLVVAGNTVAEIELVLADNDIIMVPLYLVCQGLECSLSWNPETQTATVSEVYSATIGADEYAVASIDGVILSLGAAPVIINDRTYVPLSFFNQVMQLNNAYLFEGQIVIDNFEKME